MIYSVIGAEILWPVKILANVKNFEQHLRISYLECLNKVEITMFLQRHWLKYYPFSNIQEDLQYFQEVS